MAGAVQRYFGGQGSSTRLAALLQGRDIGYIGTLQEKLSVGQIERLDGGEIGHILAGGPSAPAARLLHAVFAQAGVG